MTGLLRSLAAQALSVAPALRPAARLRAGEPPASGEVAREHLLPIARDALAVERPTTESVQASALAEISRPPTAVVSNSSDRQLPHTHHAAERASLTPPAMQAAQANSDRIAVSPVIATPSASTLAPSGASTPTTSRRMASPEPGTDQAKRPLPSAIRPESQRMRSREAIPRFEISARAREQIAQEPAAPDVHIHINRVELTAIAAPAPARRASSTQPNKPMSLDQYLQQRKRKTP